MTDINLLQKGDLKTSDFTNDDSNNNQGIGIRLSSDGGNLLQQRKTGLYYGIEAPPDTAKAVQRTERTGTLIPTNNSFKNLTVDVTGVVEVYPDGRIVQSFSFVAPVRYFHRHSAQAFYRTTLGIANFVAVEDSPILEMPLWTAMPNKVSEARVHLSSGPAYHAYSEANEWIYDWDAIFNQQANIKDKAYFSFRRWVGGTDEPVTFNIVVEGY